MKKNRLAILAPTFIALALIIGIFLGMAFSGGNANRLLKRNGDKAATNKLDDTFSMIERMYVEEVDIDSLVELVMPDLMSKLDPHSVYIPAQSFGRTNEVLEGEIEGIGVTFNMITDTIVVLGIIPNGPSYKAGVQNGDRIIKINDRVVAGQKIPQDSILTMLRGKRGTNVDISVERQDISDLVPMTITRDKILMKSVDAAFMIRPEVAFVRLSAFSRNTHSEIVKALASLRSQGMKKLIFDLRDNSGGYLDQAINLANEFLPKGDLIVYTEDRFGRQLKEFSNGKGRYTDINIVVLIDEGSASSSEILAGAVQDNDRGTIIGRRSYGKGLVQQQIGFKDGSAIRLTTAKYYTPTGRSIQKPYVKGEHGYEDDIYNRYLHNEMFSADSIRFDETQKFTTPGGKVVYGGGGIMPDIFVPIDTVGVSKYFMEARGRNYIYMYSRNYADRYRAKINSIDTVDKLNTFLGNDSALLEDFVKYAESQGLKRDREGIAESRNLLIAYLRAYIGRNTPLEDVGYYSQIYVIDDNVLQALKFFGS